MQDLQNKNYLTLKEASRIFGYHADYLGCLIREGKVTGRKLYKNTFWKVRTKEFINYCEEKGRNSKEPIFKKKELSLKEASSISGYSKNYIAQLLRQGKIDGRKVRTQASWLISKEALADYQSSVEQEIENIRAGKTYLTINSRFNSLPINFKQSLSLAALSIIVLFFVAGSGFSVNLLQGAVGAFIDGGTEQISFYAEKSYVDSLGEAPMGTAGWQSPDNAKGVPDVVTEGDIRSFSADNSAIYQSGDSNLIVEGFIDEQPERDIQNRELKSAKIKISIAIGEKETDITIQEEEDDIPEHGNTQKQEELGLLWKMKIFFEALRDRMVWLIRSMVERIRPVAKAEQSSAPSGDGENVEDINIVEGVNEEVLETSTEGEVLDNTEALEVNDGLEEINIEQGEDIEGIKEEEDVNHIENLNVIGGMDENSPTEGGITSAEEAAIPPAEEENSTSTVSDAATTTNSIIPEEESAHLTTTQDILPEIDTKIIVYWSKDGITWNILDEISSSQDSNYINGGYFEYDAYFINNWEDIENLQIKFEGAVGGNTNVTAYLDSVWVEAEYVSFDDAQDGEEVENIDDEDATTTESQTATTTQDPATTTDETAAATEDTATTNDESSSDGGPAPEMPLEEPLNEEIVKDEALPFEAEEDQRSREEIEKEIKEEIIKEEITDQETTTTEHIIDELEDEATSTEETGKKKIKIKDNRLIFLNLNKNSFSSDENPVFIISEPQFELQELISRGEAEEIFEGIKKSQTRETRILEEEPAEPNPETNGEEENPPVGGDEGKATTTENQVATTTQDTATTTEETATTTDEEATNTEIIAATSTQEKEEGENILEGIGAFLIKGFKEIVSHFIPKAYAKALDIKVRIFDPSGQELLLSPAIAADFFAGRDGFEIEIPKFKSGFTPGLWKMEIELETDKAVFVAEQEFAWGVLAVNTNKSIYLPGEQAYIQMASLDSEGNTICNADLKLEITSPDNNVSLVPVYRSGECGPNNVTDVPDYSADYITEGVGEYQMKLINLNTGYEIEDSFEVRDSVSFDVERIGPTRIYPSADYGMNLKIKANQDLTGQVIELVPAGFDILETDIRKYPKSQCCNQCEEPIATDLVSETNTISISTRNEEKEIVWDVDWKLGETYELKYIFDAPDISPYLYLIGPLSFYDSPSMDSINSPQAGSGQPDFSEIRLWQIASDATSTGAVRPDGDSVTNWLTTGGNHWDEVNDEVNEPTAGSTTDYIYTGTSLGDNLTDEFDMASISNATSVSRVIMWMYARSNPCGSTCDSVDMNIYMGGSWQTLSAKTMTTSWAWYSTTWDGSWSGTDLDNLQVRVNRNVVGSGPINSRDDNVEIATIYTDITYEPLSLAPVLNQKSFRWQNDDGSDVNSDTNSASADTSLEMEKGERATFRVQIDNTGLEATTTSYKLQYGEATSTCNQIGSWIDVGSSTEISYSWGLAGENNATITTSACATSSYAWTDGRWYEASSTTVALELASSTYTEFGFMVKTFNVSTGTNYCLRIYDDGRNQELDNYNSYGQLTIVSDDTKRYSKDPQSSSLPSDESDLIYYLDDAGYSSLTSDDGIYDAATSSSFYPINLFARKHTNNNDNIYIKWNGQTTVACGTNAVYLQIYNFNSDGWEEINSSTTCTADNDFDLDGTISTNLSYYYDSNYWNYVRVYQASGTQNLKTDHIHFGIGIEQVHYRWRNDNGGEVTPWLSGFGYRKSHTINSVSGAGTNYQINININRTAGTDSEENVYVGTKAETDFADIRFTSWDAQTLLNYWLESTTTDSASFWVKVAGNLNSSNQTIYIYYGSTTAATISSGTDTFLFFDDFDDGSLTDTWSTQDYSKDGTDTNDYALNSDNISPPSSVRLYAYSHCLAAPYDGVGAGVSTTDSLGLPSGYYAVDFNNKTAVTDYDYTLDGVHIAALYFNGVSMWQREARCTGLHCTITLPWDSFSVTTTEPTALDQITFSGRCMDCGQGNSLFDNVRIRKWSDPEPSHGDWGPEEDAPSGIGSTWKGYEDEIHYNQIKETNVRLRFSIRDTAKTVSDSNYRLQYATRTEATCEEESSVNFIDVPTSAALSPVTMATTTYFSGDPEPEQDSTTKQLTTSSNTFIAGKMVASSTNQTADISLSLGEFTEIEYNFQFTGTVASSTYYCFRVASGTIPIDGYANVATISTAGPPFIEWTGELGYENDGVGPDSANSGSVFTFRIAYFNSDNIAPTVSQSWIDLNDDGDYLDAGEKNDMGEVDSGDTDYTNGKLYTYGPTIIYPTSSTSDGVLNYSFYFYDGSDVATGDPNQDHTFVVIATSTDFYLSSSDISFSDNNPLIGDKITITATIHNSGTDYDAIGLYLSQTSDTDNYYKLNSTQSVAQSFLVGIDGIVVNKVSLRLESVVGDSPGVVGVSIQTDSSGEPSGTIVGSGSLVNLVERDDEAVWDFYFPISPNLSSSTTYWIVATSTSDTAHESAWDHDTTAPYGGGEEMYNAGAGWVSSGYDAAFYVYGAASTSVRFYQGSVSSENQIGQEKILSVYSLGTTTVSVGWTATDTDIYVYVDGDNNLSEGSENNNQASTSITLLGLVQSRYRWYVNKDAVQPDDPWPVGGTDLGENTAITFSDSPPNSGDILRLRAQVQASTTSLISRDFKFQYASGSDCSSISEENWHNIEIPWYDISFSYRKEIPIGSFMGAGTNYQVQIVVASSSDVVEPYDIDCGGNCQTDFDDIRFTDDDGDSLLDYWRESYGENATSTFWVEVKDSLDYDQNIYIYYGSSTASSLSNSTTTFLLFDDFEGTSLDTTKWTLSNDCGVGTCSASVSDGICTINITNTSGAGGGIDITSVNSFLYPSRVRFRAKTTRNDSAYTLPRYYPRGGFSSGHFSSEMYLSPGGIITHEAMSTSWKTSEVVWTENQLKYYMEDTHFLDYAPSPSLTQPVFFSMNCGTWSSPYCNASFDEEIDWVLVRKFAETEPSIGTSGNQETYNLVPWIGYNNSPDDETAITDTLLTNSNVKETYEEFNLSTTTPNDVASGSYGEWDWVIKNNGAPTSTDYCFRMIAGNDSNLSVYTQYPKLITGGGSAPGITQRAFIFENDDGNDVNSNSDMGSANATAVDVKKGQRLTARFQLDNTGVATSAAYKLQYDKQDNQWIDIDYGGTPNINSGASSSDWNATSVDAATGNVGRHTSIAIGTDGNPVVSYENNIGIGDVELKILKCGNPSCSSDNTVTTADTTSNFGFSYTSIAIGTDGNPVVSYREDGVVNGKLKILKCGNPSCTLGNTTTTVDSIGNTGFYTSIAIGTDGNPVVSYTNLDSGFKALMVLKCGNASCTAGNTTTSKQKVVDTDSLEYTSIAIGTDGNPVISYYREATGNLTFIKCGNPSCTSGSPFTVDETDDVGQYSSIAIGTDGDPVISYYDITSANLNILKCGDTSCLSGITTTTVDSGGDVGRYTSIVIGTDGNPLISYFDNTNKSLKFLKCGDSSCSYASNIETFIDDSGSAISFGAYTSMTVGWDGWPVISYYDDDNDDLKVAKMRPLVELQPAWGLSGSSGDDLTTNEAGTCYGGASWQDGEWYEATTTSASTTLGAGKCTELAFILDTSEATVSTTYRLRLVKEDDTELNSYVEYPTITIVDNSTNTKRYSKDAVKTKSSTCALSDWECTIVDSAGDVGYQYRNPIAIGTDGNPVVAYWDYDNNWLNILKCGNPSCTAGNTTTSVTSAPGMSSYGLALSLAIGNDGYPVVSYQDSDGSNYHLNVLKCGNPSCISGNTTTSIDSFSDFAPPGRQTGIAIGNDGNPVISYYDNDSYSQDLAVVKCGNLSCTAGNIITAADSLGNVGDFNSIAIGTDGNPVVAYMNDSSNDDLMILKCGNPSCTAGNTTTTVDAGSYVGWYTSIAIGIDGNPVVSYGDASAGDLHILKCGNPSCNAGNTTTTPDTGFHSFIAIDTDGNPIVSYYKGGVSQNLNILKCGDPSCSSDNTIISPDTANDVGRYTSLAIGSDGYPVVAYYDNTNYDLRITKQLGLPKTAISYFNNYIKTDRQIKLTRNQWTGATTSAMWLDASPAIEDGLLYKFDKAGYTAVLTDDTSYSNATSTAGTSTSTPIFTFTDRHSSNTNSLYARWTGQSTVGVSANNIVLQVYRFGDSAITTGWVTTTVNSSCSADTDCEIDGSTTTDLTDFYFPEFKFNDSTGTTSAEYWTFWRVYQEEGSQTLKSDQWELQYEDFGGGPSTITVSGTAYSNEGTSPLGSGRTVRIKVNGVGDYSTTTDGSSNYSISNITVTSTGDVITVFLDGASEKAVVITKASSTDGNISGLDLYQNRVIIKQESTSGDASTTIADMAQYDASDDADIQFTATTTGGTATSTIISAANKLYIWPAKTFTPGGAVTILGNASSSPDGDLHIATGATYSAGATTTLAGSWIASSSATFTHNNNAVVFTATTSGKTITTQGTGNPFYNVIFSGSGGSGSTSSEGWNSPSTVVDDDSYGTYIWTDPQYATSFDTNLAGSLINPKSISHYLKATDFNFSIPTGSTITGTIVEVAKQSGIVDFNPVMVDSRARIVKSDGSIGSTDRSLPSLWPAIPVYVAHGSSTDLWGEEWTAEDINSSNFGFAISAFNTNITYARGAGIDHIRITVYYTQPGGSGGGWTFASGDHRVVDDFTITSGTVTSTSGTFEVAGSWSNLGTFNHNNGTVKFDSTDAGETISPGSSPFQNITFDNVSGGWDITANATATNNFTITNGTVTSTSGVLAIGNNYLNSSIFIHNSGALRFYATDSGNQITSAGSDFAQLEFTGSGGEWTFLDAATSTATTTIAQGTLRHGANNDLVFSDFVIESGANFEKATGTGALYFEDTSDPIIIEDTDEDNNLGNVYIGFSPAVTNQNSDIVVDSLTVNSGDTHNTRGYEINCAGDITVYGTLNATDNKENDLTNISLGGSWLISGGTFTHGNSTTTFDATTTGKTITDGGYPFYDMIFSGLGGSWLYQDGNSTAPNSVSVANGTSTFLNAKTGDNISVTGGALNVDWYLGIHTVADGMTATDIGNATCTISENSGTPQSTIWKLSSGNWGTASTSQFTVTQTGTATGTNPQPNSDGAVRFREYSQDSATTTYYEYNLSITAQGFSDYDYYSDYGFNYLASASSTESSGVDKAISQNWYRATPSSLNGTKDYDGLNEPPLHGTWYAGMGSDLEFSVDSSSVNLGDLDVTNTYTATATTNLYATTSYSGGYTVKSYASNSGRLVFGAYYISRWPYNNDSPASWPSTCEGSAECGFGYTTNDNDLAGGTSNRFNNAANFAGFATTTPGDIVADETTAVPAGSNYTITYKVSAAQIQEAGTYDTTVYYICTTNY